MKILFLPNKGNLLSAIVLGLASVGVQATTFSSNMYDLTCSVLSDPIPQGASNPGGSILFNTFRVYGRGSATPIDNIAGHVARRFDYQYVVDNAYATRGRPTFAAGNLAVTQYTGKVIVDTYNFGWKTSYYTPYYKVSDDPISSMQLDDAFFASRIIGGGIVDAVSYGNAWTMVIKGTLANGQTRNMAICDLPIGSATIY